MTNREEQTLPSWVLPVTLSVCAVLLCWLGWKAIAGGQEPVGPPKEVHAGMYDLRAEARKATENAKSPESGQSK